MKITDHPLLEQWYNTAKHTPDNNLDITAALMRAYASGMGSGRMYFTNSLQILELADRVVREGIDGLSD